MKKSKGNTVSIVEDLVKPIADELNITIWDVQFVKEGAEWTLRIIIDKPEGITHTDCESISRPLDKRLDETDPIEQQYCLEVSSAGVERELTKDWHFEQSKDSEVLIKLIRPYQDKREFVGKLIELKDNTVYINIGEGEGLESENILAFSKTDIAYIRLYFSF